MNHNRIKHIKIKTIFFYLLSLFSISLLIPSKTFTQTTVTASLIQVINASIWQPPAPDTAGIAYIPSSNKLLVSDSEVDEMTIYQGVNVFESSLTGQVTRTATTVGFSNEPTGAAVNPINNHYFFTDDDKRKIFEIYLGPDGIFRTADDQIITLSTLPYGCNDPEGIAYGDNKLFLACGADVKIVVVNKGVNGLFDGIPPTGDDFVNQFTTSGMNQTDPEGVEYNPDTNTLYIVSTSKKIAAETTLTGMHLRNIDFSSTGIIKPAGITLAPSSVNPTIKNLYLIDRAIDNDNDPTENDSRIYEISFPEQIVAPSPSINPSGTNSSPTPSPGIPGDADGDGDVDVVT